MRHHEPAVDRVPPALYGVHKATRVVLTVVTCLFAAFILLPLLWLVINATKDQVHVYQSFGFWFAGPFRLFHNIASLAQNVSGAGVFVDWLRNTLLYAIVGAIGATILSTLAGYGFARFDFRGSHGFFSIVMASLLVPITAVALPLFLFYAKIGLVNSAWGMILPSMVSVVGIYLMRTFIESAVPADLLASARMDGAGEWRIFWQITVPLSAPGMVTVLLITLVGIWNNYFLPFMIFSKSSLYPLTVGLASMSAAAQTGTKADLVPVLITGGLITIVPIIILFLLLERYFRGGLLQGSATG